jgi:Rieske Fe-S protein
MDPAGVALGTPAQFAEMGLHLATGTKVLIGRDAEGLYALTSVCTHKLCDMDGMMNDGSALGTVAKDRSGITCNCHGSKFDALGKNVGGPGGSPATLDPLKPYALALGCDGQLYADTTMVVPDTQRLKA